MRIMRIFSIALFGIIFSLLARTEVIGADKPGVTVRGRYEYTVGPENEPPIYAVQYDFEVSISGRLWRIAYEDPQAATNAEILNQRAVASFDGTNIYFIQFQNPLAVKRVWGERYEQKKHE